MKLPEWTAAVIAEFREAGFEVTEYSGFPLVKRPPLMVDSIRLLKFRPKLAVEKRIYFEGMLLVPPGSPR